MANKQALKQFTFDCGEDDKLRKNQRLLQGLFDGIQDGISVLDKDMKVVRVNRKIEQWYERVLLLWEISVSKFIMGGPKFVITVLLSERWPIAHCKRKYYPLRISREISPRQLQQHLVELILKVLTETGKPGQRGSAAGTA